MAKRYFDLFEKSIAPPGTRPSPRCGRCPPAAPPRTSPARARPSPPCPASAAPAATRTQGASCAEGYFFSRCVADSRISMNARSGSGLLKCRSSSGIRANGGKLVMNASRRRKCSLRHCACASALGGLSLSACSTSIRSRVTYPVTTPANDAPRRYRSVRSNSITASVALPKSFSILPIASGGRRGTACTASSRTPPAELRHPLI